MWKHAVYILLACSMLFAQSEDSSDPFEFKRFLVLPIGAYSEETGIILGAGAIFFIEPPAQDGSSGGSSYALALMSSLKKQILIENKFVWEPNMHWNVLAHLSIQSWPTKYY
ncbi:MAG: hypothetical protein LBH25_09075, partial [Fibromonadaceae bacterium]|nr:hypothetical protein [Fibromonadaceae bacterium]